MVFRAHVVSLVSLVMVMVTGCVRPIRTARLESSEPPTESEVEAGELVRNKRCSANWSFLFPGLGHNCLGMRNEAIGFATAATVELGALGLSGYKLSESDDTTGGEATAFGLFAVAFQDLYIYALADAAFVTQRAAQLPLVPQDTPLDLIAAPFNLEVLKRPSVYGGILGVLALGLGVTWLVSDIDFGRVGDDPALLGETRDGRWAYPAMFGIGTGLFTHVAVAEEALFRGYIQSGLARKWGEVPGWLVGSLIFGSIHAFNLGAIPEEQRDDYIYFGLPTITVIGAYLGWQYMHEDYSLAPSTAVHFWYDLLLSAAVSAVDPQSSPVAAKIRFSW